MSVNLIKEPGIRQPDRGSEILSMTAEEFERYRTLCLAEGIRLAGDHLHHAVKGGVPALHQDGWTGAADFLHDVASEMGYEL